MTAPVPAVAMYLPGSTAVTSDVVNVSVQRGRNSPLFEDFPPGVATVMLNNQAREWDPLNAAGAQYGDIVPGRRATISATPSGGGSVTIFDGRIADWNFNYDKSSRSVAIATMEDGLAKLGRRTFDEFTSTYGELPGARLTTCLARPEVDFGDTTAFDDGLTPLQSDLVTWGSNVLNYLNLIARTDQGYLFVSRTGVVTFFDRHHFIGATPAVAFADDGSGPGFAGITTSYGSELLYNRVSIERVAGPYEDEELVEPQSVSDSTSITAYGDTFTLADSDLLMQDDTTALDLATYLLSIYKDPLYRFESITVNVHALSASDQADVLALDLGSVVSVTWTPNGTGDPIERTCVVEGITHSLFPKVHEMTLTLGDAAVAQTGEFWTVEDATYGTFDGGGTLSYPVAF